MKISSDPFFFSDRLLARLEHKLGRRLRPLPIGRPKKQKDIKKKM